MSTVISPNFRRFGGVPVEELPKHRCIIGWLVSFWLIPKQIPLLNKTWCAGNMSNAFENLIMDRKNAEVLRKICFIKKSAFLRKLLM